ncbi:MAG: hypothetical protein PHN80_12660 [Hespellia sp.]|nr:hypothetical protein [Hespellia sp.]
MEKTHMGRALTIAEEKAAYDENAKNLLSNKTVLSRIIKSCVKEAESMELEEIIACIGDDISVARTAVNPGESNQPEKIQGDNTEETVPYEGRNTYDIRFHFYVPGQERQYIKLLLNIEAQKDFNKMYDFVTRGIFYAARMISAQLDTEFTSSQYQNMKKVYSVWICAKSPKRIGNAMVRYSIGKEDMVGTVPDIPDNYDKLVVLLIYLNQEKDEPEETVFHFLNTLLSEDMSVKAKEAVLKRDFNIDVNKDQDMKGRLDQMCNLSEGIEERAIKKGEERGMKIGEERGEMLKLIDLVTRKMRKNLDSITIAEALEENEDTIKAIMEVASTHVPEYDVDAIYEDYKRIKIV